MKSLIALLALGFLASGCSLKTSVEDLRPIAPLKSTDNPYAIKVSGGARQDLSGPNVSLDVSVGFKDRLVEGNNVDVQLSISTNRPEAL